MAKNNQSITDVVCDYITKQKLSPIPVQTLNEEAETTRYFGGELKEFIAAAKTLGAKGIFVETLYLEEDDSDVDGVWFEPEDLDGLDLTLLKPQMAKFLDRVGEACGVRLTVPGVDHLEVEIFADWYDEFAEMVDEASEAIELDPNGALESMKSMIKAEEAAAKATQGKGTKKIAAHPPKKASKK